jgi:hypothetical protein
VRHRRKVAADEYAVMGLLEHSLAAHVRRPQFGYQSHGTAVDRSIGNAPVTSALASRPSLVYSPGSSDPVRPGVAGVRAGLDIRVDKYCLQLL